MSKYEKEMREFFNFVKPKPTHLVAAAILLRDKKMLLVQQKNHSHWTPPGGLVDLGETPEQAAIRETREEVGIDITVQKPLSPIIRWWNKPKRVVVVFNFLCVSRNGYVHKINNKDRGDVREFAWVSLDMLDTYDLPPLTKNVFCEALQYE